MYWDALGYFFSMYTPLVPLYGSTVTNIYGPNCPTEQMIALSALNLLLC